jgi:hypothetical protein
MKTKRRVLLITHCYPPFYGVGTRRIIGFTTYLTKFGWKCFLLTTGKNKKLDYAKKYNNNEIDDRLVFRALTIDSRKHLAIRLGSVCFHKRSSYYMAIQNRCNFYKLPYS